MKTITTLNELHESLSQDKIIIKVGTPCCGMCAVVETNINSVLNNYPDWTLYVIDGEQCDESILDELNVQNIPTVLFKNGLKTEPKNGVLSESQITSILNDLNGQIA